MLKDKLLPFLIALSAFPLKLMPGHSRREEVHELAQEWMPWALENLGTGWSFSSAEVMTERSQQGESLRRCAVMSNASGVGKKFKGVIAVGGGKEGLQFLNQAEDRLFFPHIFLLG